MHIYIYIYTHREREREGQRYYIICLGSVLRVRSVCRLRGLVDQHALEAVLLQDAAPGADGLYIYIYIYMV